jgi:hypothetical protein
MSSVLGMILSTIEAGLADQQFLQQTLAFLEGERKAAYSIFIIMAVDLDQCCGSVTIFFGFSAEFWIRIRKNSYGSGSY